MVNAVVDVFSRACLERLAVLKAIIASNAIRRSSWRGRLNLDSEGYKGQLMSYENWECRGLWTLTFPFLHFLAVESNDKATCSMIEGGTLTSRRRRCQENQNDTGEQHARPSSP